MREAKQGLWINVRSFTAVCVLGNPEKGLSSQTIATSQKYQQAIPSFNHKTSKHTNKKRKETTTNCSLSWKLGDRTKCLVFAQLSSSAPSRGAVTWAEGRGATATFLALGVTEAADNFSGPGFHPPAPMSQAKRLPNTRL